MNPVVRAIECITRRCYEHEVFDEILDLAAEFKVCFFTERVSEYTGRNTPHE